MLRLFGAELVEVPAVPYRNPNNYVRVSGRLAEQIADKPSRTARSGRTSSTMSVNRQAHVETTAPEIWRDTDGKVDGFICAVGTGGTLAGVGEGLRAKKPDVKIGIADPMGAALYSFYYDRRDESPKARRSPRASARAVSLPISRASRRISPGRCHDDEAVRIVFALAREEGMVMGGSTGINIAGAIRLAKELGPGHTIVTILCDYGSRYQSKLFNPDFMRSKGLPVPDWMEAQSSIVVPFEDVG